MSRRNGKYQCFSINAENTKMTRKRIRSDKKLGLASHLFAETSNKVWLQHDYGCSKYNTCFLQGQHFILFRGGGWLHICPAEKFCPGKS